MGRCGLPASFHTGFSHWWAARPRRHSHLCAPDHCAALGMAKMVSVQSTLCWWMCRPTAGSLKEPCCVWRPTLPFCLLTFCSRMTPWLTRKVPIITYSIHIKKWNLVKQIQLKVFCVVFCPVLFQLTVFRTQAEKQEKPMKASVLVIAPVVLRCPVTKLTVCLQSRHVIKQQKLDSHEGPTPEARLINSVSTNHRAASC